MRNYVTTFYWTVGRSVEIITLFIVIKVLSFVIRSSITWYRTLNIFPKFQTSFRFIETLYINRTLISKAFKWFPIAFLICELRDTTNIWSLTLYNVFLNSSLLKFAFYYCIIISLISFCFRKVPNIYGVDAY